MLFGGETAESYYEEGLTAAMKGDVELALGYFERALQLDTRMSVAHHQIGRCFLRMGQAVEAIVHLEKAIKGMPGAVAPRIEYGHALLYHGLVDRARAVFSDVLQEYMEEPRAIFGLACCAAARDQWEPVVGLAQRTLEAGRSQFDVHYLFARAADEMKAIEISTQQYQKCVELMDQSIGSVPEQVAGYYLRGCAHFGANNYTAALTDAEAALERVDRNKHYCAYNHHFTVIEMLQLKGRCLRELGRAEQARQVGRKIVKLSPNDAVGKELAEMGGG